jgi:cytidine deaminase
MDQQQLIDAAKKAREKAYVPYSNFAVGAALLTEDGEIITGCNVENASYPLCNCAERTAIFKAVSEGKTAFKQLAVVADTEGPVSPCGSCRQVMTEFFKPDTPVILTNLKNDVRVMAIQDLLPFSFTKEDLQSDK